MLKWLFVITCAFSINCWAEKNGIIRVIKSVWYHHLNTTQKINCIREPKAIEGTSYFIYIACQPRDGIYLSLAPTPDLNFIKDSAGEFFPEKYMPSENDTNPIFWIKFQQLPDITSYFISPNGKYMYIATSRIHGDGNLYELDLVEKKYKIIQENKDEEDFKIYAIIEFDAKTNRLSYKESLYKKDNKIVTIRDYSTP